MNKEEQGLGTFLLQGGTRPQLEPRFAYYRRCQVVRRNGEQCKAPALKGRPLCYKHGEQVEAARRYHELRRKLGLANGMKGPRRLQEALTEVAQGLLDGRIDYRTAARLTVELQGAVLNNCEVKGEPW